MSTRTSDLLEDHGEDFRFPRDFGHNVKFTFQGEIGRKPMTAKLKSVVRGLEDGEPREACLKLSSFVGVSPGAYHFYARISLGYPNYVFAANGRRWPWGCGDNAPFGARHVELEVMRRCDRRDVKHDKDMYRLNGDSLLYGRKELGDWTYQWWTEEEARAGAVKSFTEHFGPGWILVPESWIDEKPVLART